MIKSIIDSVYTISLPILKKIIKNKINIFKPKYLWIPNSILRFENEIKSASSSDFALYKNFPALSFYKFFTDAQT